MRSLKHELRTPVNHIIGYSSLLLEAAEDACDDFLIRQATEIQAIGSELNKAIERALLSSDSSLRTEDVGVIREGILLLQSRVGENMVLNSGGTIDNSYLVDMRRILGAAERLQSLLESSLPSPEHSQLTNPTAGRS